MGGGWAGTAPSRCGVAGCGVGWGWAYNAHVTLHAGCILSMCVCVWVGASRGVFDGVHATAVTTAATRLWSFRQ